MRLFKRFQKQRSFFVQLVLSNILISLVCMVCMVSILLFVYGSGEQSQKRSAFNTAAVASARELTRLVESAGDIANNLVFVRQLRPFSYRQRPMMAIELVASLNAMKSSNPFVSDIYVYFYEDDYVYCSRNSQQVEDFAAYIGQDLSPNSSIRAQLSSYMHPVYRMHNGQLLIFYPCFSSYENSGMIVFTTSAQTMRQLLPVRESPFSATLLYSGDEIFSGQPLDAATLETVKRATDINDADSFASGESFSGFDGGYEVLGTPLSNELYYLRVSANSGLQRILFSPRMYIFLLFTCACAVALTTWYMARKNYRPVRDLLYSINNPKLPADFDCYSEFQTFLSGYTGLQEKNRELSQELQEKYEMQQKQLLNALLNGNTSQYEDLNAQALDLGIDLSAAYHLLLSVQGDQSLFLEGIRPLMDYHRRYTYSLHGIQNETLYIIGCDDQPDSEALYYIDSIDGMHVSLPVDDIGLLHNRYMSLRANQLSLSDHHTAIGGNMAVVLELYEKESRRIAVALDEGDTMELRQIIQRMIEALRGDNLSFGAARYLCYEVLYHYRSYQESHTPVHRSRLLVPNLLLEEAGNDLGRLTGILAGETERLIAQIDDRHETPRGPLDINLILSCVQEHFVEPGFSLQMVADSFAVSPSYLSSYFKENYGMKMLDYCTLLRMERAKELLCTDMTLLEISQQIGYYNISSFIRRFKQMTGITPGEYKKTASKV